MRQLRKLNKLAQRMEQALKPKIVVYELIGVDYGSEGGSSLLIVDGAVVQAQEARWQRLTMPTR